MSVAAARAGRCSATIRASTTGSAFPAPGKVHGVDRPGRDRPGRADRDAQIAADELDVALERIACCIRRHRPDAERGLHRRQPVDPIRRRRVAAGLRRGARPVSRPGRAQRSAAPRADLSVRDGAIILRGDADRPGLLDARRRGRSRAQRDRRRARAKPVASYTRRRRRARRASISPAKVFGEPVFIHDMVLDGMVHARVVRQPRRGATHRQRSTRPRSGAPPKGRSRFVRDGNFLAIVGADETVVEAAAAVAPSHVAWDGVEPIDAAAGGGALAVAAARRSTGVVGAPPPAAPRRPRALRGDLHRGCTSRMPRSRRPAGWRSIATAS